METDYQCNCVGPRIETDTFKKSAKNFFWGQ